MGKNKSSNRQTRAKKLRLKLKEIWIKNDLGPDMPIAIAKLSRQISERMNIPIVPGRKIAYSVIAHDAGESLAPHIVRRPKPALRVVPAPTKSSKEEFYASWGWRTLRMEVLKEFGPVCMCCGSTPKHLDMAGNPTKIVVDHIKPLHTHWHLRLDRKNLQVLCDECNQGKGAWDTTDYRQPASSY